MTGADRETRLAAGTLAVVAVLYVIGLGTAPVYFGGDETFFATVAYSLATTGHTLTGDVLPLLVNVDDPLGEPPRPSGGLWYQPLLFYAIVLTLKVLPLSEYAVRLPAAIMGGLLAPVLMFLFARRFIGTTSGALVAALVVALSPAQFILSRQARDYICPLLFVVAWLWALSTWFREPRPWRAAVIGLVLGAGIFSHISAWVLMPMYLAITLVVFARRSAWSSVISASAAFGAVAAVLAVWLIFHPRVLTEIRGVYAATGENRPAVFEAPVAAALTTGRTLASFFDPWMLFVVGGPSLTTSTGRAGVFLASVALVLPFGLYALWQKRRDSEWPWIIAAGLVVALIPAALRGEAARVERAMCMIGFVAVVAALGFDLLWRSRRPLLRYAAMGLAILAVVQFGLFYRDFRGHYTYRSAFYYDPSAFAAVSTYLLDQPDVPAFYLDTALDTPAAKWRFFATKAGREEVLPRTRYVNRGMFPLADAPPGSLCVINADAPTREPLTSGGHWVVIQTILDVDNREAAQVLRRRP